MNKQIVSRYDSNKILYQAEAESFAALLVAAVKSGADLSGAFCVGADLRSADLSGAFCVGADLRSADLSGAFCVGADLRGANLYGANLYGANLRSADLRSADLRSANLYGADLRSADLRSADLRSANLYGADLRSADLRSANLYGADLRGAKNVSDRLNAESSILPDSGPFVGWKKCKDGIIVRLAIPSKARRSNATGRKCRAEFVKVLDVIGAEFGVSQHDGVTLYSKGKIVRCDKWEEDRWIECSGGIHFFITRYEAENY